MTRTAESVVGQRCRRWDAVGSNGLGLGEGQKGRLAPLVLLGGLCGAKAPNNDLQNDADAGGGVWVVDMEKLMRGCKLSCLTST